MFFTIKRIPYNSNFPKDIFYAYYITPVIQNDPIIQKITKLQKPSQISGFRSKYTQECLNILYHPDNPNEIIKNDENGYLFQSKNKKELYKCLSKVISITDDKFQKMSLISHKSVEIYNDESYLDRQINGIKNSL